MVFFLSSERLKADLLNDNVADEYIRSAIITVQQDLTELLGDCLYSKLEEMVEDETINGTGYQELLDSLKTGYASIGYARGRNTIVKLCKFLSNINVLIKEEQGYIFDKEPLCSGSSLV